MVPAPSEIPPMQGWKLNHVFKVCGTKLSERYREPLLLEEQFSWLSGQEQEAVAAYGRAERFRMFMHFIGGNVDAGIAE